LKLEGSFLVDILANERYLSLATRKRNGDWRWTAVWFAAAEGPGRYYIFSAANAGKVKRLRNFSEIQVAPCTASGIITGDATLGLGRLIEEASECDYAYRALRAKYGWQMRLLDFFSRLSGRIHHRQVICVEFSDLKCEL